MLHPREDYARIQDPAGLIPEDEPVFLLRAQDEVAVETVRKWAEFNLAAGGDPMLSRMAIDHAVKMAAWPVKKLADLPDVENVDHPEDEQQGETFPEQQQRKAREEIEGHRPSRKFKDGIEQVPITDEQKRAVINEHISHLPKNITTRAQAIGSASIFIAEIKDELAIALDCEVYNVPESLADYMGFTAEKSENRPGSGVS